MKQQFVIQKDSESDRLVIKEYAELDKDILSFLCEQTYDAKEIQAAITAGKEALITTLRTDNMYPPVLYAKEIADSVMSVFDTDEDPTRELLFDDSNFISRDHKKPAPEEDIEEDSEDIDELLDEDIDEEYNEEKLANGFNSSIKIAEDETLDVEEDT